MEESEITKVQKALGEPLMPEFTDYMRRVRSILVIVNLISIGVVIGGLEIDPSSSVLGIRFQGLSNEMIRKGLLLTNAYLLIHFGWGSFDSWLEWSARLTGTRVAFVTTGRFSSEHGDYPSDPRQSTLYNWWKDNAIRISSLTEPLESMEKKLSAWEKRVEEEILKNNPNLMTVVQSFQEIRGNINDLNQKIENVQKSITALRIPASLERFDSRFRLMLRSQNLRWLILELSFPLILGCWAVWLLANEF